MGLKSKKSCGHDNLSMLFIKQIGLEISNPISILVNKSLESGIVPNIHKMAKVIPIYKSKEKDLFSNYRPISLLPSMSKILEKIMYKRLYEFLTKKIYYIKVSTGFEKNDQLPRLS